MSVDSGPVESEPGNSEPGNSDRPAYRPEHPTIAQLRTVCQPTEITSRRSAEHWTADVYLRRLSPFLTRPLLRMGFSANAVTWLMIATGVLAGVVLLIPGIPGAFLAVVLGQLQMLWDCCDGEVARWRQKSSAVGIFLDSVGHYSAEASICLFLGVRAAGGFAAGPSWWMIAGGFVAVMVLFNRAMNEMVGSARLKAGMPRLVDDGQVTVSNAVGVRRVKQLARVVPLHRLLHSVELTLLIFVAAAFDAVFDDLAATQVLLAILVPGSVLVVVGHLTAIVTSNRLK